MHRNVSISIHYTMSISRQNLSIVIVTLKSEKVIYNCVKSISKNIPIIIVENSDNQSFKSDIESKHENVKCILSNQNLGMGAGNNIGIKFAQTDYVLVINPDVTLNPNTLDEIFLASKELKDFSILSPISSDINFPNYKLFNKIKKNEESAKPFKVKSVDGFAMLLNKKKFSGDAFFDENFFMYLENDDLCRRVICEEGSIFIIPQAKVNHIGANAVNPKFNEEVELSRNWHWIWSKFYFNKKHFGFIRALSVSTPSFLTSILKFLFFFIIRNNLKKKIYFNRASGFYNALLGKTSWYRPNLNN